jgi:hypothetical protein
MGKQWKRTVTEANPNTANHNAGKADFAISEIIVAMDVEPVLPRLDD